MGIPMDDIHAPTVASGPTTNAAATNGQARQLTLQELTTQKENIEAELSALGSVLDSHGVNMHTSLTTFDGYPRADIDVAQIRTTRARIIVLKNDHKAVMQRVEAAVHAAFANSRAGKSTSGTTTSAGPSRAAAGPGTPTHHAAPPAAVVEPPFAKVNTVVAGSPAAHAGLRAGDRITRFGPVSWTAPDALSRLAQVVQQNENREILVRVLRAEGSTGTVEVRLTPRRDWGGRGSLGCHLLPL